MHRNIQFPLFLLLLLQLSVSAQEQPLYKISFTERFRIETWDNAVSLSSAANQGQSFNRTLTNIKGQYFPINGLELCMAFANEFRYYFAPSTKSFTFNEVFVDQLYAKYTASNLTFTLGRQNIQLGEGFIVMDGSPLDGSRSVYFNAARVDLAFDKNSKISVFATTMPKTDKTLPVLESKDQALLEQPESGGGIYAVTKLGEMELQPYYVYKHINNTTLSVKTDIHTFGARLASPIVPKLNGTVEAAYQTGSTDKFDRSAFAGYGYLDFTTGLPQSFMPKVLTLGGVYLSGDDPTTDKISGWDPVFSRWPKWSESYIYTLVKESRVAYWSNVASVYAKAKFNLTDEVAFNLDYHHLMAPEKAAPGAYPGGTGTTRGDLVVGKLMYKINAALNGYILWESFTPGNFYFDKASASNWMRIELLYKI